MTNFEPSERDELVAAYLDGEASAAERAQVEADPELVARVETMRQVASLVAEPVVVPSLELRTQHIAAALAASATAANVSSLAARRRWSPNFVSVLSAAAAIMLILFVGSLVLLSGSDDREDTATSVLADDAATDESPADGGAADNAAEEEPVAEADLDAADDSGRAVADTAGSSEAAAAADAAGIEDGAFGEDAASDEEAPVEEEAVEEQADEATAAGELLGEFARDAVGYVAGDLPNIAALVDAISEVMNQDETGTRIASETDLAGQVQCADVLSALTGGNETLLVGTATIAGDTFEYIVVMELGGPHLIVLDADSCGIFDDIALDF